MNTETKKEKKKAGGDEEWNGKHDETIAII